MLFVPPDLFQEKKMLWGGREFFCVLCVCVCVSREETKCGREGRGRGVVLNLHSDQNFGYSLGYSSSEILILQNAMRWIDEYKKQKEECYFSTN